MKISIVASRFNQRITENLVAGARKALESEGLEAEVYWVPGAYELPLACEWLSEKIDGLVAVGTVIKGETPHFDVVSSVAGDGIAAVSRKTQTPIGFGVITADNTEQAAARSSDNDSNLGYRAAKATIDMLKLKNQITSTK